MFKFNELCELIKLVSSTKIASVEVEHAGARLRIEGVLEPRLIETGAASAASASPAVQSSGAPAAAAGRKTDLTDSPAEEQLHWVTSPIVGTFYRAPNPDAEPYVKVGDFVEPGQTLCIVEAMKLMNEIEADAAGTIAKILAANAQPVEYGERLFGLRRT